jgi:hydrogenase expression/formation protein HypD
MRVPASDRSSLLKAKARGADIRMIYSSADAVRIAEENPTREVVFFAIGFETTTPPTAVAILDAQQRGLRNFSVFCNHVVTPAAISNILESKDVRELGTLPIDGSSDPPMCRRSSAPSRTSTSPRNTGAPSSSPASSRST